MSHILFLTTNNLASNPRLYKELTLAKNQGYRITCIQFFLGNWSDEHTLLLEKELNTDNKIQFIYAYANTKNKLFKLLNAGLEKVAEVFYPLFNETLGLSALAITRRSFQLIKCFKKIQGRPDIVIGHNMGALYPAFVMFRKYNIPFVFDIEDYHPGEEANKDMANEKKRREFLMMNLLPKSSLITYASPLIGKASLDLIGGHRNSQLILNGFPKELFTEPRDIQGQKVLRLVWFSQNISRGRGLEELLLALVNFQSSFQTEIHIALVGNPNITFYNETIAPALDEIKDSTITIEIIPPMTKSELYPYLEKFDVGLALETGKDFNNEILWSNKLIVYAQAGLFILSTATIGQKLFLDLHPHLGVLTQPNPEGISKALNDILKNLIQIKENKGERFKYAQQFSWEEESKKLLSHWKKIQ